jgi:uncharacterized short protein YbdD (DUF466 family)
LESPNETAPVGPRLVRSAVPPQNGNGKKARASRSGHRSTEEIEAALGPERLKWWREFWAVYPLDAGMNPAMDAFERKVHDRELALELYHGAKRYRAYIEQKKLTRPDTSVKYAQGWINEERWRDGYGEAAAPVQATKYVRVE